MSKYESDYQNLLRDILLIGSKKISRTGKVNCLYNKELTADLALGFPMITGRKLYWKNIKWEAEWMLTGHTNIQYLNDHDVHIWDEFADCNGELGPTYGYQLHLQWNDVIDQIKKDPYSRRLLINLWDYFTLDIMALPPCYYSLQFYFDGTRLNLRICSRSSDAVIGLPYDIAVCAYFLHVACSQVNLRPGQLIFSMCDIHINEENAQTAWDYLCAEIFPLPTLHNLNISGYRSSKPLPIVLKK